MSYPPRSRGESASNPPPRFNDYSAQFSNPPPRFSDFSPRFPLSARRGFGSPLDYPGGPPPRVYRYASGDGEPTPPYASRGGVGPHQRPFFRGAAGPYFRGRVGFRPFGRPPFFPARGGFWRPPPGGSVAAGSGPIYERKINGKFEQSPAGNPAPREEDEQEEGEEPPDAYYAVSGDQANF